MKRELIFLLLLFITGACRKDLNKIKTINSDPCSNIDLSLASPSAIGSGTLSQPYVICNSLQLNSIGLDESLLSSSFRLGRDIDMANISNFNIIGKDSVTASLFDEAFDGVPFTGSFDGDGYAIKNLSINLTSDSSYIGIFGYTDLGASISNLRIEDALISAPTTVLGAVLVGASGNTTVKNVHILNSTIITGKTSAILIGNTGPGTVIEDSLIQNSTITATHASSAFIGSVAGKLECSPGDSAKVRRVGVENTTVTSNYAVGGLVGRSYDGAIIEDAYFQGAVTGTNVVGGLVGELRAGSSLTRSYGRASLTRSSGSSTSFGWIQSVGSPGSDVFYETGLYQTPGIGPVNSAGVTGLNSIQINQISSFNNFDFDSVWLINPAIGSPTLIRP
jgi:hypothetical protein